MTSAGKQLRMQRILNPKSNKTVIIPIDHGAGEGVMQGLEDMKSLVTDISNGGADVILGHMGTGLRFAQYKNPNTAFMYHLSVSTRVNSRDKNDKVLANSVESALCMGADGISIHVNIGSDNESNQLEDLGFIAQECYKYGLPLIAMMYPRGDGLTSDPTSIDMVSLCARIGGELGADIVKTLYTGDKESFSKAIIGATIPVVIAGGEKGGDKEIFTMTKDAIDAGASGLTFGRNAFQHKNRVKFIKALGAIVHNGISVEDALKIMS